MKNFILGFDFNSIEPLYPNCTDSEDEIKVSYGVFIHKDLVDLYKDYSLIDSRDKESGRSFWPTGPEEDIKYFYNNGDYKTYPKILLFPNALDSIETYSLDFSYVAYMPRNINDLFLDNIIP